MAISMVSTAPNREAYDTVANLLDMAGNRPDGLIVHTAAQTPSGEVQIVDVWESQEASDAFAQQRLMPAFEQTGFMEQALAQGPPSAYEVFDLVR
jgi:hypothetical protein